MPERTGSLYMKKRKANSFHFRNAGVPFELVKINLGLMKCTDSLKTWVSFHPPGNTVCWRRPARQRAGRMTKLSMPINLLIPLWVIYLYSKEIIQK